MGHSSGKFVVGIGDLDPRFKIKAPLRCDGIGRLDCAEDLESGTRMAVRWLPLDANGDAAVRACTRLPEHPTLPRIRQTGQMGDKAYLAMEFPDGKLLATELGEPFGGELLLEMGAQLADALATVHAQGVFHGELSAESVLMVPRGKAYLWDMPLVIANRLTDRRGEERLMHQLARTAAFLPPERARGAGASADGDVYSLAAVICLAGGAPMPQLGSTLGLVHAIATGSWAPQVPAVFHEPFKGLLQRMLSRESSHRPSAREVADLLGRPAGAIRTIPEMPAIVLPAGFVMPGSPIITVPVLRPTPAQLAADALLARSAALKPEPTFEAPVPAAERPADVAAPVTAPELANVAAAAPAVPMNDSLSVAAELANDSISLTAAEAAAAHSQASRPMAIVAAVVLSAVTVLGAVAFDLARVPAQPTLSAQSGVVASPPLVAPAQQVEAATVVPVPEGEDEDLAPLPVGARPRLHPRRSPRSAPAADPAPGATAAPVEVAPVPQHTLDDFGFLEGADEPRGELKRPQF